MKISISDWANFEGVLPLAKQYKVGLEVLEFGLPESFELADNQAENFRQSATNLPYISMHGPFSDLAPASRDPLIRNVTRERFNWAMDLARAIGAQDLVLHSGFIPKTYPRDIWVQNSYNFWIEFINDSIPANFIHVENVYEDDFTTLLELSERVNETLQREALTLCLDIGHVNANSSRTLKDWITNLGDRIRYVHLHNNDGVLDDHWEFQKGNIDIAAVLALLQQHSPNAAWTIETLIEDIEPSLVWMQGQGYL